MPAGRTVCAKQALTISLPLAYIKFKTSIECAALRSLQRVIDERRPPFPEVVLAASALAELPRGSRRVSIGTFKRLLRHGYSGHGS